MQYGTPDAILEPKKKDTSGKMSEILIKFKVYLIAVYQHWFLCSDSVP